MPRAKKIIQDDEINLSRKALLLIKEIEGFSSWKYLADCFETSISTIDRLKRGHMPLPFECRVSFLDKKGLRVGRSIVVSASESALINRLGVVKPDSMEVDYSSVDACIVGILLSKECSNQVDAVSEISGISVNRVKQILRGNEALTPESRVLITSRLCNRRPSKWILDGKHFENIYLSSQSLYEWIVAGGGKERPVEGQGALIDLYKERAGSDSDSEFARSIGITRQQVSHARSGITDLSLIARIKMVCRLDALESVVPPFLDDEFDKTFESISGFIGVLSTLDERYKNRLLLQ